MLARFADPPGEKKSRRSIIRCCEQPQIHPVVQYAYSSAYNDDDFKAGEHPRSMAGIADNVKVACDDQLMQHSAKFIDYDKSKKVAFKASIFDDHSLLVSRKEQVDSSVLGIPLVAAAPCGLSIIKPWNEHENNIDEDVNEFSQVETEASASSNKDELSASLAGTDIDKNQKQERRVSWISTLFSRRSSKPSTSRKAAHT